MSPPTVRVNTFVKNYERPFVDVLSKVYLILVFCLGLNRLSVLGDMKTIFTILALIYTVIFNCLIISLSYLTIQKDIILIIVSSKLTQFFFLVFFGWISRNRVNHYYLELNRFDNEVGCRPKTTMGSIRIVVHMAITLAAIVTLFVYQHKITVIVQAIPIQILHAIECHYYAHLISLLVPRIRLINYLMELSLTNNKIPTSPKENEFTFFKTYVSNHTNKLMDYYTTIIKAHDLLIDATKWQLLLIITTSFVYILGLSYHIALRLLRAETTISLAMADVCIAVLDLSPLIPSCLCCDQVLAEVKRLRELIGSSLYQNKIDKPSRSAARALLALTEARRLSFSLLHMMDISISLPFSFVGLLVTYLIILVQFEKVINPSKI